MLRAVTLDCRGKGRVRTGTQPPLGTPGGFKRDQLPAIAGPSLRVGVGEDRGPPGSQDGIQPPGGARGHAGSELSPARLHGSAARIDPRLQLGRLPPVLASPRRPRASRSSPSLPYPPGCAARAPGRRPAGTVPSPYSRWLSGGCHSAVTCPSPRQGSADQLITGGKARAPGRPRPPLWRAHAGPRPTLRLRPFAGGGVATFQNSEPLKAAVAGRGWCPLQPVGKKAPCCCCATALLFLPKEEGEFCQLIRLQCFPGMFQPSGQLCKNLF